MIRALTASASLANENVNRLLQELSRKDEDISSLRKKIKSSPGSDKFSAQYERLKNERRALKKRLQNNELVIQALSGEKELLLKEIEVQRSKSDFKTKALEAIANNDFASAESLLENDLAQKLTDAALDYYEIGKVKILQLKFSEALKKFEKAISIDSKNVSFQFEAAKTAHATFDLNKAVLYFENTIALEKEAKGELHPDIGLLIYRLGHVYRDKLEFGSAKNAYEKAIEINTRLFGSGHPFTLQASIAVGGIFELNGEYPKALAVLQSTEQLVISNFRGSHDFLPVLSSLYYNLGRVCYALGKYDKALGYYSSALFWDEIDHGEDSMEVATCHNQLGLTYIKKNDGKNALACYDKVFVIYSKEKNVSDHYWAAYYNNVALAYELLDRIDDALVNYFKAYELNRSIFIEDHPDLAGNLTNIGNAYYKKEDYEKCIEYNLKALEIDRRLLGEQHHFTGEDYKHIGDGYYAIGKYADANKYYTKAFLILPRALGLDHFKVKILLKNMRATQQKLRG